MGVLVVGMMLIIFVIGAPKGIVGLVQDFMRAGAKADGTAELALALAIFANMRPGAR